MMYSLTASKKSQQWGAVTTLLFLLLSCLVSQTTARAVLAITPQDLSTSIDFNAPLEIDTSEPPIINQGEWILLSPDQAELKHVEGSGSGSGSGGLSKREEKEITSVAVSGSVTTTFHIAVSTITEKPSTATTATTTTGGRAEETAPVSSSLPKFFDGSLSANFAPNSNCPSFLNAFLNNQTFNQCYPISLLMQVRLPPSPSPLFFTHLLTVHPGLTILLPSTTFPGGPNPRPRRLLFSQRNLLRLLPL